MCWRLPAVVQRVPRSQFRSLGSWVSCGCSGGVLWLGLSDNLGPTGRWQRWKQNSCDPAMPSPVPAEQCQSPVADKHSLGSDPASPSTSLLLGCPGLENSPGNNFSAECRSRGGKFGVLFIIWGVLLNIRSAPSRLDTSQHRFFVPSDRVDLTGSDRLALTQRFARVYVPPL